MQKVNRRKLMKMLGAVGMTSSVPFLLSNRAHAALEFEKEQHFFLMVQTTGGMDAYSSWDPKADDDNVFFDVNNDISTVGNITYANASYSRNGNFNPFFEKHFEKMCIIPGINAGTTNHRAGRARCASGSTQNNAPNLAAVIAAANAPGKPLSYIGQGGYDTSGGIIPQSRLEANPNVTALANPNFFNNDNNIFNGTAYNAIKAARAARTQRLAAANTTPSRAPILGSMYSIQTSENALAKLEDALSGAENNFTSRMELAAAAFFAGVTQTATLEHGGWDMHRAFADRFPDRMSELLEGIDAFWEAAETLGIADRCTVYCTSDFGRANRKNNNNGTGKGHNSTTCQMMMGAGVTGNVQHQGTNDNGSQLPITTSVGTERVVFSDVAQEILDLFRIPREMQRELTSINGRNLKLFTAD